jgi:epoxide hydrolase-like predicted phosphatase
MPKAVIFDVGGVLIRSPIEGIFEYESTLQLPRGFIGFAIDRTGQNGMFARLERGELEVTQEDLKAFGNELSSERVLVAYERTRALPDSQCISLRAQALLIDGVALWRAMMGNILINHDMVLAVLALRAQGYLVAVLTNNFRRAQKPASNDCKRDTESSPLRQALPVLFSLFHVVCESAVEGVRKPDPEIYHNVLTKLQTYSTRTCTNTSIRFSDCVFLDDLGVNVRAAQHLGMSGIRVGLGQTGVPRAIQELSSLLQTSLRLPETLPITQNSTKAYTQAQISTVPLTVALPVGRDGQNLVCDLLGDLKNPLVLFLHGGGQTRHTWRGCLPAVAAQGYLAAALDMKGHGDSYWDPEALSQPPVSVADYYNPTSLATTTTGTSNTATATVGGNISRPHAYSPQAYGVELDCVLDILALLSPTPPVLVGASLGGLAVLAAPRTAERSAAVVLVDITPSMQTTGVMRIVTWMRGTQQAGFANLEEAAECVRAYNPSFSGRNLNKDSLMRNLRVEKDGRLRWHWDPRFLDAHPPPDHTDPLRLADSSEKVSSPEFIAGAARLREAGRRCLLVHGLHSDIVNAQTAAEFKHLVPQGEYVNIRESAHMVVGDANDVFLSAIGAFLASLPITRNSIVVAGNDAPISKRSEPATMLMPGSSPCPNSTTTLPAHL